MNIDKQLREALILRYQGEVASAKANITVYMNSSVGIGEHPEKLQAVQEHFVPDRVVWQE